MFHLGAYELQRRARGFINANTPVFASECMSVAAVYGYLISTCTFISVCEGRPAVVVCRCIRLENRLFETQLSERGRVVVPGTCTPEGDGWRERWRRGEMEINRGSEDKGV